MTDAAAQSLIRFGLGARPSEGRIGDPRAALKAQLQGPDPGLASGAFAGLPSGRDGVDAFRADAMQRREMLASGEKLQGNFKPQSRAIYVADARAQLGWAATTDAGFRERLVWFWSNHFTVSVYQGGTAALAGAFVREAIRPHVTGNFTDMVLAAERHPAMLRYLNNDASVGPDSVIGQRKNLGLNENLGRECMELHTVGLAAGYSQADVTSMANILTGWSIAGSPKGDDTGFKYRPLAHEPGVQTVMGQRFDGGEAAGVAALSFLSRQPSTYQLLARKLAIHFVADAPPAAAVQSLAEVLMATGGDLAAVSAALVDLPGAWAPLTKLKTPAEYVISALRAVPPGDAPPGDALPGNTSPDKSPSGKGPENAPAVLARLGQTFWGAPLPNGWPDQAADWDGSDAILSRVDWAYTYAGRVDNGNTGAQPAEIANAALGGLLRPATAAAIAAAGSRREAVTLLFASPEFQRR
jgi:uncharacterized protein (DUF1800 family)